MLSVHLVEEPRRPEMGTPLYPNIMKRVVCTQCTRFTLHYERYVIPRCENFECK